MVIWGGSAGFVSRAGFISRAGDPGFEDPADDGSEDEYEEDDREVDEVKLAQLSIEFDEVLDEIESLLRSGQRGAER